MSKRALLGRSVLVNSPRFRVQGLGFRVQGLGFGDQGFKD